MSIVLFIPVIAAISTIGAYVSWLARQGHAPLWAVPMATLLGGLLWTWTVKSSKGTLAQASMYYDVVMSVSYVATFLALGDRLSLKQGIGVVIAFMALLLLHDG